MKVAVVGTGYVGLVTGVCLSKVGHHVTCVDNDPARVADIRSGKVPFFEPDLEGLLQAQMGAGSFAISDSIELSVGGADLSMISVGTPSVDGRLDSSALASAATAIGRALGPRAKTHTIVVKSTVLPGTTRVLVGRAVAAGAGCRSHDLQLAMNPEFLREGTAVSDFSNPDRIVIGSSSEKASRDVLELYAAFDCPKITTTLENAELTKYGSNALLALLISFSNELAALCEQTPDLNVDVVLDGMQLDRRLSPLYADERIRPGILSYLRAGIGFGGSCLPKDVAALRTFAHSRGIAVPVMDGVAAVNAMRPAQITSLLAVELGGSLAGKAIALLGLAFKPGTDDVRDSPALRLLTALTAAGAHVKAYDPMIRSIDLSDSGASVASTLEEALRGADAAVLATAWPEFRDAPWARLAGSMKNAILMDGRGALRGLNLPKELRYRSIGTSAA